MIYLSSQLLRNKRYKKETQNFVDILKEYKVLYNFIDGTKDIWVRDFMPIQSHNGPFYSFKYEPSYLIGREDLRTDYKTTYGHLHNRTPQYSKINLDGGNVVFSPSGELAIISERVFSENSKKSRDEIINSLSKTLRTKIIFIPCLSPSEDMTGHADGMVHFVDDKTVIVNESLFANDFEWKIKDILLKNGLNVIEFPFYLSGDSMSAEGCYLNIIETENIVFVPQFSNPKDEIALQKAHEIFHKKAVPVPLKNIAKDGGGLRCITWITSDAVKRFDKYSEENYRIDKCPVCGKNIIYYYNDLCEICFWEEDGSISDEWDYSPANGASLTEYRENYNKNKILL